jgi:putative oxidoreductase
LIPGGEPETMAQGFPGEDAMSIFGARSSHPALSRADGFAAAWQDFLLLAARVLMGWIFVQSGWRKLMDMQGFVASMPRRDLPGFMAYIAAPVEFLGGLALVLGFATRYTAVIMFLFVLIAAVSSHRWWNYPAAQQGIQQSHFMKNVTIMGGMVLLFITGAGRFSLDAVLSRRR